MVLIRGARVVDGTGKPARQADVLVSGERISAIGKFPRQRADTVIDGTGTTLTPGFIDVNTDSDHYLTLFTEPEQGSFLLDGVTTAIGGNCGASLAPLLYGSLESIGKWTDPNRVNVGWHRVKDFLRVLETKGIGINFGTLAGHATIRHAIIGDSPRDLTDRERQVFARTLGEALEDGALGFSTGLGHIHASAAPFHEIKALLQVVQSYGGVYATHLRNEEDGLLGAVDEAIRIIRESRVRGIVSHLRPIIGFEREFGRAVEAIEVGAKTCDVHFDSYPFNASFVSIYTLLPHWVRVGGLEAMSASIRKRGVRDQLLREFPKFGGSDITIVESNHAPELNGKTIGTVAENRGISPREALLEVMVRTKLRATVLYQNLNEDLAMQGLLSPNALVASNAPAIHDFPWFRNERFHGTFKKFISFVQGSGAMEFEKAIQKITSIPAKKFGLKDRGEIKEGKFADLVFYKDGVISDVFVNGVSAVRFGKLQNARGGKVLRRT